MNKFMKFLALVLVMGTLLAFAACTPSDNTTTTAPNNSSSTTPSSSTTTPSSSTQERVYTYRIKVIDEQGNIVPGAWIQMCGGGNCFTAEVEADGYAYLTCAVRDDYEINMFYIPDDYAVPEGKEMDESHYPVEAGKTEFEFVMKLVDKAAE